jgi:cytochrome oxidase Cu insertion factor (SCO1/SenC/PrrC family)
MAESAFSPALPPRAGTGALLLFVAWLAITLAWWALAFMAAGPATPPWLARTQSVCFGTLANGLPDSYGWTRLILAPLLMLAPLLAVHGRGIAGALGALWSRPLGRAALALLVALPLAQAGWVGSRVRAGLVVEDARGRLPISAESLPETYPRQNRPAPAFRLRDQHGRPVALADLRGQVLYLTFAFAHCTSTCPITVHSLVRATRASSDVGARAVVITLDPWRDTPAALPGLAAQWGLEGLGSVLSGSVPQVLEVLARYDVPTERDANTGNIVHPALVYVIDRAGRIAFLLNNPSVDWIVAAGHRAAQG